MKYIQLLLALSIDKKRLGNVFLQTTVYPGTVFTRKCSHWRLELELLNEFQRDMEYPRRGFLEGPL